jgi:vacuolar-type H+-ATPase subunit E/Vma4
MSANDSSRDAAFQVIRNDLEDMKASMSKMADALAKIAVLEERHQVMSSTLMRILEKLDKVDSRQNNLEMAQMRQATTIKVSVNALKVAWGVLGAGVLAGVWQFIKMVAQQG